MSARRLILTPLALVMLTACSPFRSNPPVEVRASDPTLNSRWHATLASPAALAGAVQMRGSASMAPSPDSTSTNVFLTLANASPGGVHPWAVHMGQCGTGTDYGMFGTSAAYTSLEIGSDGKATATATLQRRTPSRGGYFVVVRASTDNPETIVACGNLAPPTQ